MVAKNERTATNVLVAITNVQPDMLKTGGKLQHRNIALVVELFITSL